MTFLLESCGDGPRTNEQGSTMRKQTITETRAGRHSSLLGEFYVYCFWSEVLAADAFAFMMAHGGCTTENGHDLRHEILSRGSSRDPMASFKAFRGREPAVEALLIRRGLK